ncbi:glycosyltransferase [filamentous cyanobacterium LEGE 11480]|uniref:Glycosyltransferase n=1 Tax=Romeriopsis navalis LEGE 11480 TaxID=2777977 RepID=A0A928VMQ1_9CYAN|nr:glycosyltransferase [Romeriopsis navalis]MBE9028799.1 glycosyltransferase [Romeriopsis navalis LEGE 11480]
MNVLFLTTVLPARKLHGSEIASQNFVEALQHNQCNVTVVGYGRHEDGTCPVASHEVMVADRAVETKQAKFQAIGWFALSLLKRLPYSAAKYISRDYIEQLKTQLVQQHYDAIVIDHAQLGWLMETVGGRYPVVFVAHNLEHDMYLQHYRNARNWLSRWVYQREAKRMEQMEVKLGRTVTQTWTLTEFDADYFSKIPALGKVMPVSLPSGFVAPSAHNSSPKQFDIGIIGSWSWKPNLEGLEWFLAEVYPQLPAAVSIHVAGRGIEWLSGKYPNVTYEGFVDSAQAFMSAAKVMAIPTLSGGGIQIKTLDAIASGAMIVGTPVAMRGIAQPPATVRIASEGPEFATELMAMIAANDSPAAVTGAITTAQDWQHDREQRFFQEISDAMQAIQISPQP